MTQQEAEQDARARTLEQRLRGQAALVGNPHHVCDTRPMSERQPEAALLREAADALVVAVRERDEAQGAAENFEVEARIAVRERDEVLRGGLSAHPTDEGGPGHEDEFWMKLKLQAAIRHLRDIEDEFRLRGGLPEGFNQKRADRARQLHEAISDDFLNGKMNKPTVRERADAAERERDQARDALRQAHHFVDGAIEEQGETDDDLLALPGTMWARLLSARDVALAALAGGETVNQKPKGHTA